LSQLTIAGSRWSKNIDAPVSKVRIRVISLTVRLADADAGVVVTHGEPHPGNLLRTRAGLTLIDWDTVALARPERDLWMIADAEPGGGGRRLVARYQEQTGITLDPEALVAYRRLWALADLAAFTRRLRGEHHEGADARQGARRRAQHPLGA
jgi:spectinomycin phosphotransferase